MRMYFSGFSCGVFRVFGKIYQTNFKKIKRKKEKKPSNLQTDKQKQLKFGLSLELRKLGPLIQVQSLISVPDNWGTPVTFNSIPKISKHHNQRASSVVRRHKKGHHLIGRLSGIFMISSFDWWKDGVTSWTSSCEFMVHFVFNYQLVGTIFLTEGSNRQFSLYCADGNPIAE